MKARNVAAPQKSADLQRCKALGGRFPSQVNEKTQTCDTLKKKGLTNWPAPFVRTRRFELRTSCLSSKRSKPTELCPQMDCKDRLNYLILQIFLQVILEVLRHFVHQVDAVAAEDVVLCHGVGEVVYGDFQVDAGLDEAQAVLPHHGVVYGALAD